MLLTILITVSCAFNPDKKQMEKWKEEVRQAEADFANMAEERGISIAFRTFAAKEVALKRRNKLIIGIDALKEEYSDLERNPDVLLTWEPDYIDVSKSGDMAYTYGSYAFSKKDSLGNVNTNTGVFHTVWKRQPDGSWKYVWD